MVGEEGHGRRGGSLGRWKEVKHHMSERGASRRVGIEQTRRECMDRESWRLLPWPPAWETFLEGARHQGPYSQRFLRFPQSR